jgi:hypothetical protein
VQSSDYGLGSARTIGLGSVALALLALFVVRQARGRNPILPLRIFTSRKISAANVVQALMSSAFLGFFFMASLDLERVLNYGPLEIGLAFLPVAVVMGLFSVRFSAPLITRFGPLGPLALLGLGGGLSFPALTIIAMADARPDDAGLASGILNTTGQVGGALGLAILATLAGARSTNLVRDGLGAALALAGGYHLAWLVSAATVIVTLAITMSVLRTRESIEAEATLGEGERAA